VTCTDIVTPYGAAPLMLFGGADAAADERAAFAGVGLAWYAMMLNGTRMQGPCGATEAAGTDGAAVAPLLTWDVKGTSLLAMLGGTAPLVQQGLAADGVLGRFTAVVEREYGLVFPPPPPPADARPLLPTATLPYRGGFAPAGTGM
jgi:hypothetical protein